SENEWHISSEHDSTKDNKKIWFEKQLFQQFSNVSLITAVGYESLKDEMEKIYCENIKIKSVIANQPIVKEGSQCTFAYDIENHHIHTY
ncbi:11981_t:CDS:1, partial [Funneliformis mosseae]